MIQLSELQQRAELLASQNTEIEWRDSIKHSYYYVFHNATKIANKHKLGLMLKNSGEHQFLIEKIRSVDSSIAKTLARDLEMIKARRTKACYYLGENISQILAKQQLKDCESIMVKLNQLDITLSDNQ